MEQSADPAISFFQHLHISNINTGPFIFSFFAQVWSNQKSDALFIIRWWFEIYKEVSDSDVCWENSWGTAGRLYNQKSSAGHFQKYAYVQ